jgi:hypothetical protein
LRLTITVAASSVEIFGNLSAGEGKHLDVPSTILPATRTNTTVGLLDASGILERTSIEWDSKDHTVLIDPD